MAVIVLSQQNRGSRDPVLPPLGREGEGGREGGRGGMEGGRGEETHAVYIQEKNFI